MKKALVIRYGAFGDNVICSQVFRLLKEDGYHVVANISKRGKPVLDNNPHIDEFMIHDESITMAELPAHWKKISAGFDKVVNLTGSVEMGLLKHPKDWAYYFPKFIRHMTCNRNYYDESLKWAGYDKTGLNGELFWTEEEEAWAKRIRKQNEGKFMVLWSLSGSSYHKAYPFAHYAAMKFLDENKDARMYTVGDDTCRLLEWDHPRSHKRSGVFSIRKSMILTKYADLVVGPETGILNAAGCYETPKVLMLSHSTEENLSKYWVNCTNLYERVKCYPCHQLHYDRKSCPTEKSTLAPICTAYMKPSRVYDAITDFYIKWKTKQQEETASWDSCVSEKTSLAT